MALFCHYVRNLGVRVQDLKTEVNKHVNDEVGSSLNEPAPTHCGWNNT